MNAALADPFMSLFIRRVDLPLHRFDSVLRYVTLVYEVALRC